MRVFPGKKILCEIFLGLINDGKIISRGLSWVTSTDKIFFKIPRISESLDSDIKDPRALKLAKQEFNNLLFLKRLDDALVSPVDLLENYSCVVMERIKGFDLIDELKTTKDPESLQLALEEGISICARLHRFIPNGSEGLPYHDYSKDRFWPAGDKEIKALKSYAFTVVAGGYEIRNLMRDRETGRLKFFDPHILCLGAPEEDFTRYVLSILMANWGRHLNFLIWKKFDLSRLIKVYEETRGVPLNKHVLRYTFDLNVAMRKFIAEKNIKKMKAYLRPAGLTYRKLYFYQIDNWRHVHGS